MYIVHPLIFTAYLNVTCTFSVISCCQQCYKNTDKKIDYVTVFDDGTLTYNTHNMLLNNILAEYLYIL